MQPLALQLRRVLYAVLPLLACAIVVTTRHWPLTGDAVLMHYTAFLFDHHLAPYRQIVDINMPGCLFFDWAVIHALGPGSLAWRLADFALLAAATLAMVVIARPYDPLAGLFAGVLFSALHIRDGIDQSGERDLILTVLLLLACAALLTAWRRSSWQYTAAFALLASCATLIKPTALLWTALLLALTLLVLRKRRQQVAPHLAAAAAACLIPLALTAVFLLHQQALGSFFFILRQLDAYHVSVDHLSFTWLLTHPLASALLPLAAIWLYLTAVNKQWSKAERAALLLSMAFGWFCFVVQGKGFPYHRYPMEAFFLLTLAIDATCALRRRGLPFAAAALLLYATFILAPVSIVKASRYDWRNRDFVQLLSADLNHLGGPQLSTHVQCIDTFGGCTETLYDLRLLPATGYLYDCYAFHQPQTPISQQYRDSMLAAIQLAQPRILVVTDQLCFSGPNSFSKLANWPAFTTWLDQHYTLYDQRRPIRPVAWWPYPKPPIAYRIYVNTSALVARANADRKVP